MKFSLFAKKAKNKSGIIIIIVLWILIILTALVVSLGRSTSVELALTKNAIGKMKAKYLAWAGLIYAINEVRKDSEDSTSSLNDPLYFCAIPMNTDVSVEKIFDNIELTDGTFTIGYHPLDRDAETFYHGLQDEERFLNINAIDAQTVRVFTELVVLLGFDEEVARTAAYSIVDWVDDNDDLSHQSYGAESEYYSGLPKPYLPKNRPFDSKAELMLVRGIDQQLFEAIEPYITVYPPGEALKVNFDTASAIVLKAVMRALTGAVTNTDVSDADSLVLKILDYREGDDGQPFTSDDRSVNMMEMALNAKERVIFLSANQFKAERSEYIRAIVTGRESRSGIEDMIETVIRREDLAIISWRR